MNCDYVFERLTRGPFPAGDSDDAAVEKHLRACHDCRRLAHSLQPSVGLFHESMTLSDGLPEYSGELAVAAPSKPAVKPQRATPAPPPTSRLFSQLAVVGFITCACAVVAWFAFAFPQVEPPATAEQPQAVISPAAMVQLAALELPAACLPPGQSAADVRCCTECHNASHKQRPQVVQFAQLTSSCMACHTE